MNMDDVRDVLAGQPAHSQEIPAEDLSNILNGHTGHDDEIAEIDRFALLKNVNPELDGIIVVNPKSEEQIIDMHSSSTSKYILVNPIPSNYGRIDWNGSVLTIT